MYTLYTPYKNAQYRRRLLHSAIVAALLSLSACATTGENNDANSELDLSKYSTITTHDAVNNLESSYRSSNVNDLATFAPNHYSTAGKAIEDAKALLAQSQPREKVVQKVAVAEAVLKNGDRVMKKVKDILENELTIKEKLDSLNTKSAYSTEYGSLNDRLNKLILSIESGHSADDQNREKLLKDMQKLERKSLHYSAMNEPQEILKRVKYRGGEQLAPITYGEALAVFKRAEEFILQNPNYDIGIIQIGREALFAAKRALYITEGVSALKQKVAFAPEQVILDEEYRMYRVARQLGELDYRDNSLEVQSELLAKEAEGISLELKNKDDLVIALRDTLIKVRDSSSRLTMLSESTVRLKQEKNEWLAKEALFKAKVDELATNLKNTESQLDSTQQLLLSLKADNTRLTQQVSIDEQKAKLKVLALTNELAQLKSNKSLPGQQAPVQQKTVESLTSTEPTSPIEIVEKIEDLMPEIAETAAPKSAAQATPQAIPEIRPEQEPAQADIADSNLTTPAADTSSAAETEDRPEAIAVIESSVDEPASIEISSSESDIAESSTTKAINDETNKPATSIATQIENVSTDTNLIADTQDNASPENTQPANIQPMNIQSTNTLTENAQPENSQPINSQPKNAQKALLSSSETKPTARLASTANEKIRAKVTEEETLEAIKSAKELINTLKATEVKLVGNTKPATKIKSQKSTSGFLDNDESDAFVDASE